MLSALNVADFFIRKGFEENAPITHMKLQFLLFLAQGDYMALHTGQPLFPENFERWKFGPVCRDVYDRFKEKQDKPLNEPAQPTIDIAAGPVRNFLDWVWLKYRQYTSSELLERIERDFPINIYPVFESLPNEDLAKSSVRRLTEK